MLCSFERNYVGWSWMELCGVEENNVVLNCAVGNCAGMRVIQLFGMNQSRIMWS